MTDDAKTSLADEFKKYPRIVAPFQELRQTHGNNEWEAWPDWIDDFAVGKNAVRAAALLKPDDYDGVVRHLTTSVCVFRLTSKTGSAEEGRWLRVPSLAEAAVHGSQEEAPCNPEDAEDEQRLILFKTPHSEAGPIRTVSASELVDKNGDSLPSGSRPLWPGAFVVIGQTDAEASADQHRTVLIGMMPGVSSPQTRFSRSRKAGEILETNCCMNYS